MENFAWLQYVGNPYTVIAVIAAIVGASFRATLKKVGKPNQTALIVMYTMFLLAIISLVLSVVAIVFLLSGVGATDAVNGNGTAQWRLVPPAYAQEVEAQANRGWVWVPALHKNHDLKPGDVITTDAPVNLRDSAPKFVWWWFHFRLGQLTAQLPSGSQLQVLHASQAGDEWWCEVEVLQ